MHRRDYVLIAKVLKKQKEIAEKKELLVPIKIIEEIISNFCIALKEENSSFNEQKFRDYIQKGE